MSGRSSAAVESITRGLSIESPGTVDGREPVAMIACSNVERLAARPSTSSMLSVFASTNDARPWM